MNGYLERVWNEAVVG